MYIILSCLNHCQVLLVRIYWSRGSLARIVPSKHENTYIMFLCCEISENSWFLFFRGAIPEEHRKTKMWYKKKLYYCTPKMRLWTRSEQDLELDTQYHGPWRKFVWLRIKEHWWMILNDGEFVTKRTSPICASSAAPDCGLVELSWWAQESDSLRWPETSSTGRVQTVSLGHCGTIKRGWGEKRGCQRGLGSRLMVWSIRSWWVLMYLIYSQALFQWRYPDRMTCQDDVDENKQVQCLDKWLSASMWVCP